MDLNEAEDLKKAGIWNYKEAVALAEKRFNMVDDLPEWARETVIRYIKAGAIGGSGTVKDIHGYPADLDLSYDMIRTIIFVDRYKNREVQE